jgi:hypothetical protein
MLLLLQKQVVEIRCTGGSGSLEAQKIGKMMASVDSYDDPVDA